MEAYGRRAPRPVTPIAGSSSTSSQSGRHHLSYEEADAFLRVLNEGRLALGARFGLEVEEDHDRLPEEQRDIMDYLGWLLEDLTAELTRSL